MRYSVKTKWWLKLVFPKSLVWDIPANGVPTVYITFDDGPHPTITPFALDLLHQYNATATFFCVGENVTRYPDVFNETIRQGHAVANHTFNHLNGWKTPNNTYLENIEKADQQIHSALFRPPYGKIRWSQTRAMTRCHPDWRIIMWSVLSADFDRTITPQQCLDNVLNNIRPGSIILLHDSEKAWDRMSYALPRVLEHCKQQGWQVQAIPA